LELSQTRSKVRLHQKLMEKNPPRSRTKGPSPKSALYIFVSCLCFLYLRKISYLSFLKLFLNVFSFFCKTLHYRFLQIFFQKKT
jgi:hypothetical protein